MVQQSVAKARIRHGIRVILRRMTPRYIHTCIRVQDIERSLRFYSHLGFEHRGRLNFGSAYNIYLGLPGGGDVLELTVNVGREEPYDLGDGYNHMALVVDDLVRRSERLDDNDIQPEKPPYDLGGREDLPLICFVPDPDGYRIELVDDDFPTPQDPPSRSRSSPPASAHAPGLGTQPPQAARPQRAGRALDSDEMSNPWLAIDVATAPAQRAREVRRAWERFVGDGWDRSKRDEATRCAPRSRTRGGGRRPPVSIPPGSASPRSWPTPTRRRRGGRSIRWPRWRR